MRRGSPYLGHQLLQRRILIALMLLLPESEMILADVRQERPRGYRVRRLTSLTVPRPNVTLARTKHSRAIFGSTQFLILISSYRLSECHG